MNLIIDFYKSLDTLNLIIFWGIIIVIILLLIFSIVILNKNKKLKSIINSKTVSKEEFEDIIIKEEPEIKVEAFQPTPPEETFFENEDVKPLEEEKQFIAEEHVMEYNKKNNEPNLPENKTNEMPTGPYQRNVLREMSLNQTSPIGIIKNQNKDIYKAKELNESLNEEKNMKEYEKKLNEKLNQERIMKKELLQIKNNQERITKIENEKQTNKVEIKDKQPVVENKEKDNQKRIELERRIQEEKKLQEIRRKEIEKKIQEEKKRQEEKRLEIERKIQEEKRLQEEKRKKEEARKLEAERKKKEQEEQLLRESIEKRNTEYHFLEDYESEPEKEITKENKQKEKYLQEVSKKLAEADKTDDIDRTEYELEQEELAIISYEELMQKKDSIKMIDEEEAVISIEELMNKGKKEEKLYNLTKEEENDKFIRELKDFRNDL